MVKSGKEIFLRGHDALYVLYMCPSAIYFQLFRVANREKGVILQAIMLLRPRIEKPTYLYYIALY